MVVRDWKEPNSVTGIRQFLGFTNYFRRFIEGYSFIARPLEELTGKNKCFSWNEECQAAFEALQKAELAALRMRILAVLGIEVTACVTILARITRRPPPARGADLHTGREAPKSSKRGNESWAACVALAPRTGRSPKQEQ